MGFINSVEIAWRPAQTKQQKNERVSQENTYLIITLVVWFFLELKPLLSQNTALVGGTNLYDFHEGDPGTLSLDRISL